MTSFIRRAPAAYIGCLLIGWSALMIASVSRQLRARDEPLSAHRHKVQASMCGLDQEEFDNCPAGALGFVGSNGGN